MRHFCNLAALLCAILALHVVAGDWPHWGGNDGRNMVSDATGIPDSFDPGPKLPGGEYDTTKGKNIKWVARLGSYCCGNPTVAGGKVFVGTNNVVPRNPKYKVTKDGYGVVMCLDESSGKFLWQCCLPAIPTRGNANMFFAQLGVCSAPLVDGDRVYFMSNRAEIICLSTTPLGKDKNDGPYKDEAHLYAPYVNLQLNPELAVGGKIHRVPKGKPIWTWAANEPIELDDKDADIIWRVDLLNDLPCWVQDAASCSLLLHDDLLYVYAPNGVDLSHKNLPTADCPSVLAMDKKTGKIVATDDAKIGPRTLHSAWSSPSIGTVGGKTLLFFAGPDGVCYAFNPKPVAPTSGSAVETPAARSLVGPDAGIIKKVWQFDGNLPQNRFTDPRKCNYAAHDKPGPQGPSEYIATAVFHEGRVYIANGQDPRHGAGPAVLSCIDASKEGDITDSGKIWQYTDLNRTLSSVSVANGLVFIGDLLGAVHCIDAATGKACWVHQTGSPMWGSSLVVDGKVFIGNEKGELHVFAASKELKVLSKINLGAPIYSTPIVANGVLYVASNKYLYAIQQTNR
ncbi:MAG TPA: PQQ-binding-like beta-propeller repeat protein [Planctomycetota bacterium]|jgi:outer membrane protein assembly factor BamB